LLLHPLSCSCHSFASYSIILLLFFFFQAEDGIRDFHVTGVQTCALPISPPGSWRADPSPATCSSANCSHWMRPPQPASTATSTRSEERRVGKECRSRWWPEH